MNNTEAFNYLGLKLTGSSIEENNDLEVLNAIASALDPSGSYDSTTVTEAIIKLGDAYKAGGGSADWKEAIGTFSWDGEDSVEILGACALSYNGENASSPQLSSTAGTLTASTDKITIGLYKGKAAVTINTDGIITTSGDIELIGGSAYAVTGDFSVTITKAAADPDDPEENNG